MNATLQRVAATLRQWQHPREFRIAVPAWPSGLQAAIQQLAAVMQEAARENRCTPSDERAQQRKVAEFCTALWRSRQMMLQPGTDRPREEMRRTYRHFEAAWDALKPLGVELRDHTGERYSGGSGLDVAAFEPRAGLGREMVVETIKPTIVWKKQLIQVGQVIVGTPERQQDAGSERGEPR